MYKKIHFILIGFVLIVCYTVYSNSTENKYSYDNYDDISTLYEDYSQKYNPDIMTESEREDLTSILKVQSNYITKALYKDFKYIGNAVIFNFVDNDGTEISVIVEGKGSATRFRISVNFFKPGVEYILFLNNYYTSSISEEDFFQINNDLDINRNYYALTIENDISKVAVGNNYNFCYLDRFQVLDHLTWGEIQHIDYITTNADITQEHYMEYSLLVQKMYDDGAFNG